MSRTHEGAYRESLELLKKMEEGGIESSYDRYDSQQHTGKKTS